MEGPAKERLTGALILIAALVIVVPEMLSGPKATRTSAAAGSGAASDAAAPLRTYSMDLNGAVSARPDQSALVPVAPTEATRASEPRVEAPVIPPLPAATAPPKAAPVAEPVPPPTALEAQTAAAGWWAQLGSFSSRDNAERLARSLRGAGFTVDVSRTRGAGKELHRVRAGPVASRDAAIALQGRLAALGHKASLVAP